ncbi:MAG: acetyl-CoA carboxylase biotin carboxyl carrier protein [Clostridiaceae bacterium]|nr:acetyl-CoA carboxylase biotin carboxyl carrier protein [Clostridiaceae bacterium]
MDNQEIKDLMDYFDQSKMSQFQLKQADFELNFKKDTKFVEQTMYKNQVTTEASSAEDKAAENILEIKTPLVGTFYVAPGEDADPYVQVGDIVEEGQTLCIVEAMKTMNEIPAPAKGKIVEIIPENGELLGYDSILMILDTDYV